jgi:uncharacterized protein (TIGR00255 family)
MIYSMTGFAISTMESGLGSLTLELRAVNHRYLDVQFRLPDEFRVLEPALREAISAQLARGKIECRISYAARNSLNVDTHLNQNLLLQLIKWNTEVRNLFPNAQEISVVDVLRWNGMLESETPNVDGQHAVVLELMQKVLLEFSASRAREGERLKDFLLHRVELIEALRIAVAPHIPAAVAQHETKLRVRLLEALGNDDSDRVLQEITLYASKIDVDEELSRLQAHLLEMRRILEKGGVVGKRLDFLMQELNREANTLGSKSVDAEVSRISMEIKLLIEQMREQIQNIE